MHIGTCMHGCTLMPTGPRPVPEPDGTAEQMTVPEAAESLGLNLNTAYGRLRAARAAFNEAVARMQKQMGERAARGIQ